MRDAWPAQRMSLPMATEKWNELPAKFRQLDADVELRMQCFLTVKDAEGKILHVKVRDIEGWCIPAETMKFNESPEQAAVRVARTWFETPVGMWLDRVLSFPATGGDDNRWYVIFVFAADAPAGLKGTPDTEALRWVAPGEPATGFAMAHADVWTALGSQ